MRGTHSRRQDLVAEARSIVDRAEREDRDLSPDEEAKVEANLDEAKRLRERENEVTNMTNTDAHDVPSFGGEGRHIGHDSKGREIRSYQAGDRLFETEADLRGYDAEFWGEPDHPLGKFYRAAAVGPRDDWERRAISSTAGGGDIIPDPIRLQVLDRFSAQNVLARAGAQFVTMESADLDITRVEEPASHSWSAEGTTSSSTDMTFESRTVTAQTLRGIHEANRETVADAPDFPAALERELTSSLNEELQRVAFVGSGSGSEPEGLYNSTSVTKLDFGGTTNGTVPSSSAAQYGEILRARKQLLENNVPDGNHAYVWSPRTDEQFASLTDANHQPLQRPGALDRVRELVTTSVPSTLAPGSETNQSAIFYGRYSDLVVGVRMDPSVEILRERYAESYRLGFLSFLRAGIEMQRPDSFTILDRVSST